MKQLHPIHSLYSEKTTQPWMDSKSGGLGGIPQDFAGMVGLSSGGHIYANMPPQES